MSWLHHHLCKWDSLEMRARTFTFAKISQINKVSRRNANWNWILFDSHAISRRRWFFAWTRVLWLTANSQRLEGKKIWTFSQQIYSNQFYYYYFTKKKKWKKHEKQIIIQSEKHEMCLDHSQRRLPLPFASKSRAELATIWRFTSY